MITQPKNKKLLILSAIVIAIGVFWLFSKKSNNEHVVVSTDPSNTTYTIEGKQVTLKNGQASEPVENSSALVITKIFSALTKGDINADGKEDTAVVLTQTTGGSGTFFYAAAALKTETGYTGTNAILLGDRVAPQTVEIKDDVVIVNYADRNPGESFSVRPSAGKSLYLVYKDGTLKIKP